MTADADLEADLEARVLEQRAVHEGLEAASTAMYRLEEAGADLAAAGAGGLLPAWLDGGREDRRAAALDAALRALAELGHELDALDLPAGPGLAAAPDCEALAAEVVACAGRSGEPPKVLGEQVAAAARAVADLQASLAARDRELRRSLGRRATGP